MGKVIKLQGNNIEGGESDLRHAPLQAKIETVKIYTNSLVRVHNGEINVTTVYATSNKCFENHYSIA